MRIIKKFKDPCEWHDYFCWLPVCITWNDTELKVAWLETIERKKRYTWIDSFWEYRFKVKISAEKEQ